MMIIKGETPTGPTGTATGLTGPTPGGLDEHVMTRTDPDHQAAGEGYNDTRGSSISRRIDHGTVRTEEWIGVWTEIWISSSRVTRVHTTGESFHPFHYRLRHSYRRDRH